MLKKLDILIIKAFIGPFIATFFITTFVLVLQFMWLYIDDVVGKGIDAFTVLRLLTYVAATVVPLALPLAVLLSSIMTLGNLGETYELVAIKSAGISLLRFLRPLAIVSLIITVIAFFFNNNVLPISNLKMQTLKYDIIVSKPAFDIKEGVFYDKIEGFVIKIGKKEKDDSTIRNVVIYEQNNNGQQDNMIVADSGTMVVTPDKQSLIFTLKSGWRYQEKGDRNVYGGTELVRMGFKQYKKVMDLSSFRMNKTDDSTFKNNFQMLTILQLGRSIDSLKKIDQKYIDQMNAGPQRLYQFPHYLDTTGWAAVEKGPLNDPHLLKYAWVKDSLTKLWTRYRKTLDSTEKVQKAVAQAARKTADSIKAAAKATAKKTAPKPLVPAVAKTVKDTAATAATTKHPATSATTKPAATAAATKPPATTKTAKDSPATAPTTKPGAHTTTKPGAHTTTKTRVPAVAKTTPATAAATKPVTPITPATKAPIVQAVPIPPVLTIAGAPVTKDPPQVRINDMIPEDQRSFVLTSAIDRVNQVKGESSLAFTIYISQHHHLLENEMAWHEKITLAVACMVMFLIGAPLGSIIRKGGIGLPLVFAVVFFVIFFLLNNFGKKLAGSNVLTPANGLWLATYVLTPMGLFLVYKALHDSQLFNKEFYFRLTRKLRPLLTRFAKKIRKEKKGEGEGGPAAVA